MTYSRKRYPIPTNHLYRQIFRHMFVKLLRVLLPTIWHFGGLDIMAFYQTVLEANGYNPYGDESSNCDAKI